MGEPQIWTAESAEALLAAATSGPWTDAPPYTASYDPVKNMLVLALTEGDSALIAAAHGLAASVAHHDRRAAAAEAEVKRLRDLVRGTGPRFNPQPSDVMMWDGGMHSWHVESLDDDGTLWVVRENGQMVNISRSDWDDDTASVRWFRPSTGEVEQLRRENVRLRDHVREAYLEGWHAAERDHRLNPLRRREPEAAWESSTARAEVARPTTPEPAEVPNAHDGK